MSSKEQVHKALCPLPWISASFNTDSSFRVCCNTSHGGLIKRDGKKIYINEVERYSEIQKAETLTELKKNMLEGRRSSFCSSCYDVEDASGISIRQYYVKKYADVVQRVIERNDLSPSEGIQFLDFSLTNNCNLKCRMCTPGSSYLLSDDFEKLDIKYDKDYSTKAHTLWKFDGVIENLIDKEQDSLSDILFTGGEPLTNQIHLKVLQALVQTDKAKNITLTYHSNLMVLPDLIVNLWQKFKKVDLHLSLEGHGAVNNYIRHNSNWNKISENLEKLFVLKQKMSLWIEIHTVFQAYNLTIIPDYLAFLRDYDHFIPSFPHFIWLDQPSFLSANSLPENMKLAAIKDIESYLERHLSFYQKSKFKEFNLEKIQILRSCLNRMTKATDEQAKSRFINYTTKLDRLRNQNVLDFLPQLQEVFSSP